jgi:hypothetical protein
MAAVVAAFAAEAGPQISLDLLEEESARVLVEVRKLDDFALLSEGDGTRRRFPFLTDIGATLSEAPNEFVCRHEPEGKRRASGGSP